jgi:hypothetical protein
VLSRGRSRDGARDQSLEIKQESHFRLLEQHVRTLSHAETALAIRCGVLVTFFLTVPGIKRPMFGTCSRTFSGQNGLYRTRHIMLTDWNLLSEALQLMVSREALRRAVGLIPALK